jgi:hypothetical protein
MTSNFFNSSAPAQSARDDQLFSGIWLRWSALNIAERFVCANIVLVPVWWVTGLRDYMSLFMLGGIFLYEWRRYGKVRLKKPSLATIALFAFFTYEFVDLFLLYYGAHPSVNTSNDIVTLNNFIKSTFQFSLPCLVWYIQSNDVRVRPAAVAWACSVVVVLMLLSWGLVEFVFPNAFENAPRSLYAILTGKPPGYEDGLGHTNYLLLYDEERRYGFFFGEKQTCATYLGFVGLLALDVKNRFWSFLLLAACVVLMIPPAARSVWVAFPIAVFVRFILASSKVGGAWVPFTLVAVFSFSMLSVPPITNSILNLAEDTATTVSDYRQGSTEARSEMYQQTLTRILDKPLFGHKVSGVVNNDAFDLNSNSLEPHIAAKIGTHSVPLGRLLYQNGLVGTGIFATFWVSLMIWLYDTRSGRPVCWFPILVLFTLMSNFTFLHSMYTMGTLLCMLLRRHTKKTSRKSAYA